MTHGDYESRFAEALDVVRQKFPDKIVGQPKTTPGGIRLTTIDGTPCKDEVVFGMAWHKETARDIVAQRRTSGR